MEDQEEGRRIAHRSGFVRLPPAYRCKPSHRPARSSKTQQESPSGKSAPVRSRGLRRVGLGLLTLPTGWNPQARARWSRSRSGR